MENTDKTKITISITIDAPIAKVWELWTSPEHIVHWNNASADWYTPKAENDLRVGGKFEYRMEAKDGSFGFDFFGFYDEVKLHEKLIYTLGDNRKVDVTFTLKEDEVLITQTFEAEETNPIEMQKFGWQAILDNFKKYVERNL